MTTRALTLVVPLALAACSPPAPGPDGGAPDLSAVAGDGGDRCATTQPAVHLYEDACPGGGGPCFIDTPPTDFF
jgi:hypothetical protein